jgi:IclR family acetate operon transcriptional repressor
MPAEISGTVEKALEVLFHLHAEGAPQGVTAIGRALGLPKSTAHRLITALGSRGLVEQDDQGRYRPGMALVSLGLGVLEHEPVVEAAGPVLEETALEVGETLFLSGTRAGRLLVLDKREGSGFLRAAPRVGAEIPVHATAIGKVFLAFAPERVAAGELTAYTEHTVTDARALEIQLEAVRRLGFAEQSDEWQPGLAGIAAPVHYRGRLAAALAISGPVQHFGAERRDDLAAHALRAAARVAARLEGEST